MQHLQLRSEGVLLANGEGGVERHLGVGFERVYIVDHIADGVPFHLHPGYGRKRTPDACKHQFKILIQLSGCTYGGTWVAGVDLLLYGHRRGDVLNQVYFGLGHTPQKLSCIRGETFHIPALPFGIECVEGQTRLARPTQSGDYHQFPLGYIDRYVFQIVYFSSVYLYHG